HASPHPQHNLGRFRISVSEDPEARLGSAEARLQAALAIAPDRRNEEQAGLVTRT
ncbi:MAG: hypothetical protein GWO24_04205, partial [Akkermansiaceae bacterium]|nr:hypothetical protein [Akkermansiaceae bacterium]